MAEYLILINEDESSYATATPDVLQQVMSKLRSGDYGVELQFTNYRSN